jgi:hypothetical protein
MERDFSRLSLVMLGWLIVQFLVGMATNLFVDITRDHPGANPPEYFSGVAESVTWAVLHGPFLLQVHAVLGLILLIGAVSVFLRAMRHATRPVKIATGVGGVAILGAGLNGGSFLNYNEDFSSMIMSGFFAIAVAAYVASLFLVREAA